MVNYFETVYSTKGNFNGVSKKERVVNDGKRAFKRYSAETPTKEIVTFNDKDIEVSIQTSKFNEAGDKFEKIVLADLEIDFNVGDFFFWKRENKYWIIIYIDKFSISTHIKGKIRECNHLLKWKIDDKIYTTPTHIVSSLIRSAGLVEMTTSNLVATDPGLRIMGIIKDNPINRSIKRDDRFLLSEKPWKVIAIDDISILGIRIIRFSEDILDRSRDNLDEGIVLPYTPSILNIFEEGDKE